MDRRALILTGSLATASLATASLAAGSANAGPGSGGSSSAPQSPTVNMARVGLPVITNGRLNNYVFLSIKLHLASGRSSDEVRAKEPHLRDALVKAAHRTPFSLPNDWTRLDEGRVSAALTNAANTIIGRGAIARVEIEAQSPRRRSGMPTG